MFLWSNPRGLHPFYAADDGASEGTAFEELSSLDLGGMIEELGAKDPDEDGEGQPAATPPEKEGQPAPAPVDQPDPAKGTEQGEGESGEEDPEAGKVPPVVPPVVPKEPYTQEELIALNESGKFSEIDTSRLPDWAKPIYQSFNAAFTRSNQELVRTRKELEGTLTQIKEVANKPPQQPPKPVTKAEQWQMIDEYIVGEVAKDLGIPIEEVDADLDRTHKLAYNAKYQELVEQSRAKQQQTVTVQAAAQEAQTFIGSLDGVHGKEPDYQEVLDFYPTYRRSVLTTEQNEQLDERFRKVVQTKDAKGLEDLYQELKTNMYRVKHGIAAPAAGPGQQKLQKNPSTPPHLLKPGGKPPSTSKAALTKEKLRKMDKFELGGLIEELGAVENSE